MIEITPRRLYIIGMWCFLIVGVTQTVSYVLNFPILNIWSKIGNAGTLIFNFALAGLFKYLLTLEPQEEEEIIAESDDINEIIKEVTKEGQKNGKNTRARNGGRKPRVQRAKRVTG